MKSLLLLVLCLWLLIAAACAAEDTCDPDSNGKPVCPANSNGQTYRNFWDPTRYWVCNGAGEPTSESCPDNTGYSGTTNKCIPWTDWVWVPPCGSDEVLLNINLSA